MTPFETFKLYVALKKHFTSKSYDIVKTKGAISISKDSFDKRRDLIQLYKISKNYKRKEIIDLLVANFASGDKSANIFGTEYVEIYKKWLTRRKRLLYNLDTDLDNIIFRMEKEDIKSATKEGQHPLIFRMYMGKDIHIETLVIMEKLYPFVEDYANDQYLDDICLLVEKYKPFVRFDKDNVKQRFAGKFAQCLNQ